MPVTRYTELNAMRVDPLLRARVEFALLDRAFRFAEEWVTTPANVSQGERQWAAYVLQNPGSETHKALNVLLADNKDVPNLDVIHNADDATVQAKVDSITSYLVLAYGE
jgi:hypothetical protein